MYKVEISLIISSFHFEKKDRVFVSSNKDIFSPPKLTMQNNNFTISYLIDNFIRSIVKTDPKFQFLPILLDVDKSIDIFNIYYAIMLSIDTQLNSEDHYLISKNIAIIDPIVRRALSYV